MSSIRTLDAGTTHADGVCLAATGEKIGFYGTAPVVLPASANQAALTDSTGGSVADATLAAVGATNTGDRSADINGNFAKIAELVNAMRSALVSQGLIKGSA